MSIPIKSGEYLNIPKTKKLTEEEKKVAKKKIAEAKERDSEMVTGTFKNIEAPGCDISFWFKKYDEPPVYYNFFDGQNYTIPRMVAEHINTGTEIKQFEYQASPFGPGNVPVISPTGKAKTRYLFVNAPGL